MSKVMPITGAVTAVILAVAPGAHAQVTSSQDSSKSPWPTATRDPGFGTAQADSTYIRQALRGNFTEVGLGRVAESRAEDDDVEDFAERMISEHGSMYEDWEAVAKKIDMKTDVDLEQAQEPSVVRLRSLSGTQFDQAYMAEMIRLHEQDLAAFQRMGTSARSPEVRQLATSGSSTIQQHLALARQVGSRVGVATTAGRTGGVTSPTPTRADSARRRTTADRTTRSESDDRDDRADRADRADRKDRPPLPAKDRPFVQEALGDHLMHIRLAKRAQREGKMEDTRELGERIEKTFTQWRGRWENVADRRDVEVPSNLERPDRQRIERLDGASERGFDRTYARVVANHLERVVQNFRKKGPTAESAAVRGLTESELPVLRELLSQARRLEKEASERREDSERK